MCRLSPIQVVSRVLWVGIAAGLAFVARPCAAETNVVAWGLNNYGQSTPPPGLQAVRAADAGPQTAMAVRLDGTIAAWGSNQYGLLSVPSGLSDVVQVAVGLDHAMAVRADGTVVCWGSNSYGQLNVPTGLPPIKAIAAETYFSVALSRSGTVHAWGSNQWGQLNIPGSAAVAIEVSAGGNYIAALRPDHVIAAWGFCGYGQCFPPADIGPVAAISAGNLHMMALTSAGTVRCWGWNRHGQSAVPAGLDRVVAIAAGMHHSVALRETGEVVCWGAGCAPSQPTGPVVRISAGWDFSVALLASDSDGDGVDNSTDNCPRTANPDQADGDGDGIGDYCDGPDSDGDGVTDAWDGCPLDSMKAVPGLCGCGEPDIDENRDGVCDSACPGDLNGDGSVSSSDLPVLLNAWGATGPSPADIDGDGVVGPSDLTAMLTRWGTTCAPAIDMVQPPIGPVSGGTTITITGKRLAGAIAVEIGGLAATSFTVLNQTTLTAVTPPGSVGARSVVVTTPGGIATSPEGFTYRGSVPWGTTLEDLPDPAIVFDSELRARIVAAGYPWRVRDSASGIEMVLVPAGTFEMGCIMGSNNHGCLSQEQPVHSVTLTNAYYIGRYEVTQAQWMTVMGSNPAHYVPSNGYPGTTERPVEQVPWVTIQEFLSATGLRLPTEAEWEYAYRAGTTTPYHSGPGFPNGTTNDELVSEIGWWGGNSGGQTHAVGGRAANALGIHDMHGNVWEWCHDWYGGYASGAQTDPVGPESGPGRVHRGGAWDSSSLMRSSTRSPYEPWRSYRTLGFRVAKNAGHFTVAGVAPGSGPTTGGTLITIIGTNLGGVTSVTVGGVAATSVTVRSPTELTAVTPAGAVGSAGVSVTTPHGTKTIADGFTYSTLTAPSWATLLEPLPDPAIVSDAGLRARIVATGYPWRVRDNGTGIEMVLAPPGSFLMGCDEGSLLYPCSTLEQPAHSVTLPNAFYIGRYEVTQVQWQATMGSNPSYFQISNGFPDIPNRPVEFVSWNMIQGFLAVTGLRLPTEAEWEYAYRGGTTAPFPGFTSHPDGTNDDALAGLFAWYAGNNGGWGWPDWGTKPVGQKAANRFGLHDMGGNLWEWVSDWYGPYTADPVMNPTGPSSGEFRVWRGGGFQHDTNTLRASYRSADSPNYADGNRGFRVARSPS